MFRGRTMALENWASSLVGSSCTRRGVRGVLGPRVAGDLGTAVGALRFAGVAFGFGASSTRSAKYQRLLSMYFSLLTCFLILRSSGEVHIGA